MIDETTILFIYLKRGGGGREEGFLLCFVISVSLYIYYSLFFVNSLILTDPFKCRFTLNLSNLHIFSYIHLLSFIHLRRTCFQLLLMGCTSSKHELSQEDLEFLKTHTSFSEKKIKTWYKGFMV